MDEVIKNNSALNEIIKCIRVRDIKSVPVVVTENATIYDAVVTMFTNDVGTLSVINNEGLLSGVVTRRDVLKATLGKPDLDGTPVSEIMTMMPAVVTVTKEETVYMAAKKLHDNEIDSLPVVKIFIKEDGEEVFEVIGRISRENITSLFVEIAEKYCYLGEEDIL